MHIILRAYRVKQPFKWESPYWICDRESKGLCIRKIGLWKIVKLLTKVIVERQKPPAAKLNFAD